MNFHDPTPKDGKVLLIDVGSIILSSQDNSGVFDVHHLISHLPLDAYQKLEIVLGRQVAGFHVLA